MDILSESFCSDRVQLYNEKQLAWFWRGLRYQLDC